MITEDKVTEIFCIIDEFCKFFEQENGKKLLLGSDGKKHRMRKASLSDSEIMTILLIFHFGSFRNFKHYYTFVDSTMIPVCHNMRRYANRVFKGIATDGKGTMGWCHGFKLHLACNDRGEILSFLITGAHVSDKNPDVLKILAKRLYGKLFADKGYISQKLFDTLFEDGIYLVTGLRSNMKNRLMPFYDKIMLRKRHIIETINDMLKNEEQIVHSRHRSLNNFIMNLISALGAYCFFDNKPQALQGYVIENTKQLSLF